MRKTPQDELKKLTKEDIDNLSPEKLLAFYEKLRSSKEKDTQKMSELRSIKNLFLKQN